MKKIIAMLLVLTMVLAFAGCAGSKAMTHEQYVAAEMQAQVTVETYVQAHQSWWDNKVTVYCQSPDGAYFLYELACSEEDAAKLTEGTKIRVTGYKGEWAGEVEIMDGTFEFVKGDSFVAEALDVTALLGKDELIGLLQEEEDPTFSIYADETVPIKEVVKLMNIAKRNHYKVIMATSPE